MKQNFFTYLPSEIMTEILIRVLAQAILSCKCTCKSWQVLVETQEFVELYLSRSISGLALTVKSDLMDKIVEHTDNLHISAITKLSFNVPFDYISIQASTNGLLLLQKFRCESGKSELHLCNPITREYIDILYSHSLHFEPKMLGYVIYGVGVSKTSGQYKVVGIFHDQANLYRLGILNVPECKLYTIGTGSWRNVTPHALVRYNIQDKGAFVNGSLHWLAYDLNNTPWISCFDLEIELFNTFSISPLLQIEKETRSWTKKFFIESISDLKWVYPAKNFKDGVILTTHDSDSLFYYSTKNKITQKIYNTDGSVYNSSHSHTPGLLSLKCFTAENVVSF